MLKELRKERTQIVKVMTAEDAIKNETTFKELESKLESIDSQIARAQRAQALNSGLAEPAHGHARSESQKDVEGFAAEELDRPALYQRLARADGVSDFRARRGDERPGRLFGDLTPNERFDAAIGMARKASGLSFADKSKSFRSFGEQLIAVYNYYSSRGNNVDARLVRAPAGAGEVDPTAAGFLVQTDFAAAVFMIMHDMGEILSRVNKITLGEKFNGIKIPAVDEVSECAREHQRRRVSRHAGFGCGDRTRRAVRSCVYSRPSHGHGKGDAFSDCCSSGPRLARCNVILGVWTRGDRGQAGVDLFRGHASLRAHILCRKARSYHSRRGASQRQGWHSGCHFAPGDLCGGKGTTQRSRGDLWFCSLGGKDQRVSDGRNRFGGSQHILERGDKGTRGGARGCKERLSFGRLEPRAGERIRNLYGCSQSYLARHGDNEPVQRTRCGLGERALSCEVRHKGERQSRHSSSRPGVEGRNIGGCCWKGWNQGRCAFGRPRICRGFWSSRNSCSASSCRSQRGDERSPARPCGDLGDDRSRRPRRGGARNERIDRVLGVHAAHLCAAGDADQFLHHEGGDSGRGERDDKPVTG